MQLLLSDRIRIFDIFASRHGLSKPVAGGIPILLHTDGA